MKKVLFIDRDGTIISEPLNEQVDSFEEMRFLPMVITSLSRIVTETDYELVMVTNQDGLGSGEFPEETFWPSHNKMLQILEGEGIRFADVFIDRTYAHENAPTRKPGTAMLARYLAQGVDLSSSFVIGDRETDLQLARNLGCRAIYVSTQSHPDAFFNTADWRDISNFLISMPRRSAINRITRETSVFVDLNIDGSGKSDISTGIGFLDHMLEQLARHSGMDLTIKAKGDLEVDRHHTIEDVAIALGEAISGALGSKKGIERYGFLLPMDDSLAQVAIDFSGRPWLTWTVCFSASSVGDIPAEMFRHFFKSLSDSTKCNINITAEGDDDHHKIEAIFKAFARAMKAAVTKTGSFGLPSTKGIL
ncbi:MAG: bifunctional histidinol-phosphatase/imidazoleglycerol-phosphate dehydratase HisB [Bacteroidales bacterium]